MVLECSWEIISFLPIPPCNSFHIKQQAGVLIPEKTKS